MEDYCENNWDYSWNYQRLVLKPEFRKLDFCMMPNFYFIVSERLKNAIEEEKTIFIRCFCFNF